MFGVGIGMTIGMASGMVGRMIGGNVLGLIMGVTFGVTIGVLGGMTGSVALGISFTNLTDAAIVVSAVFGVMGGMAATLDIEIGVAVCLTFLIIGAMSFGAEFIVYHLFGTRFGALLARGMMSGAFIAGAFRVLLYPFQWGLAFFSFLPGVRHPFDWDELIVLPLPWTRSMLFQRLRKNEDRGLQCLAEVWRNLFCRPAIQAVFYRYLHKHRQPFRFLYGLLRNPDLEAYMLIPMTPQQWEHNVSVLQVMLGELALHHVEATHNPRFQRSAWWLNLHIYKRRPHTPLTRFAGMLYDLLGHQTVETDGFDLAAYESVYRNVSIYPDGKEIEVSFSAMATCLGYQDLAAVAGAQTMVKEIEAHICLHKTIRPSVFIALTYLSQIGTDIAHYHEATTNAAKLAALAHATGRLNDLHAYVCAEVTIPERGLLQRIVQQWQQLIVSEIGELGKLQESQKEVTETQAVVPTTSTRSREEQAWQAN